MRYLQQELPVQIEKVSQISSKSLQNCSKVSTKVEDKNNKFLTATAWKDKGKFPVKFLSTLSKPIVATHCVWRVGSSRQRIPQPLVAHQYNHSYGFVDTFDLYCSKYKVGEKFQKSMEIYIFLPYWCSYCEFIPTVQGEFYPPYHCEKVWPV